MIGSTIKHVYYSAHVSAAQPCIRSVDKQCHHIQFVNIIHTAPYLT